MTADQNKNIIVSYNQLNLPKKVTVDQGYHDIRYVYDADGNKLSKQTFNTNTLANTTLYEGEFQYLDNALQFISTSEGRAVKDNGKWRYEYNINDHLGNLRAAFSDLNNDGKITASTELLQETNYYPFGLEHRYNSPPTQIGPKNKYTYNSKELQDEFNLNWLDHGARMNDPQLGRWHVIDPLAEDYLDFSPFAYVLNNPIILNDPTGMAGNLSAGAHFFLQKGDNITMAQFLQAIYDYSMNFVEVWDKKNGADISKITFSIVDENFDKKSMGKNDNLVEFKSKNGDPTLFSGVSGNDDQFATMYLEDMNRNPNVSAHEIGHHFGLSDRYLEGAEWNISANGTIPQNPSGRRTTPIQSKEIPEDPNYNHNDNLYSNGSSVLTPYQLNIARTNAKERDYQQGRGKAHQVRKKDGKVIRTDDYKVRLGKVIPVGKKNRLRIKSSATRNLKRRIIKQKLY